METTKDSEEQGNATIDCQDCANCSNASLASVAAIYDSHEFADEAVKNLLKEGFDAKDLTVVGMDYHTEEHPVGFVSTGDRVLYWGKCGAFWGTMWGLLFGSALFFVPGAGPLVFSGWLASTVLGGLEGAVVGGGIGALSAALTFAGLPKESVIRYESEIQAGNFLLMVKGRRDDLARARKLLEETAALRIDEHGLELELAIEAH